MIYLKEDAKNEEIIGIQKKMVNYKFKKKILIK